MNKIFLLLLPVICICNACKKGSTPVDGPNNPNNNIPINFELTGLTDLQMLQHDTAEFMVELKKLSGTGEKVSLGVNNLVDHFVISFTPSIDTPSYFSNVRVITDGADTGTRSFQVVATGSKLSKYYNINIKVLPDPPNPAAAFPGNYLEQGACTNSVPDHLSAISLVQGKTGYVRISGFWANNNTYSVEARIDAGGTVEIEPQQSGGLTFQGSGTYSGTTMQLNYTVTAPFVSESCSVTLTKQ